MLHNSDGQDVTVQQLNDFLREATFLKDLNHANILKTIGVVWSSKELPYVVLPYMQFGNLLIFVQTNEVW